MVLGKCQPPAGGRPGIQPQAGEGQVYGADPRRLAGGQPDPGHCGCLPQARPVQGPSRHCLRAVSILAWCPGCRITLRPRRSTSGRPGGSRQGAGRKGQASRAKGFVRGSQLHIPSRNPKIGSCMSKNSRWF